MCVCVRFVERRCKSVSIKNVCEDEKQNVCEDENTCICEATVILAFGHGLGGLTVEDFSVDCSTYNI